jgi:hypothetical protein
VANGKFVADVKAIWPRLVDTAALHGKTWRAKPGPGQVKALVARMRDGAAPEDLAVAIGGFIARNTLEGRVNLKYCTVTTIYARSKFDANVEAGYEAHRKALGQTTDKDAMRRQIERNRQAYEEEF